MVKKFLFVMMTVIIPLSFSSCKGKGAKVEDILTEKLNVHLRITNDVFYEKGKESGKGTTIKIAGPVKVVVDKDGKRAVTETSIELRYVNENTETKAPVRVSWEFKDGNWSAVNVLPEDFGFIIAFNRNTLEKIKKK